MLFKKHSAVVGVEAFLDGVEACLNKEVLTCVGIDRCRGEFRADLGLSLGELWKGIRCIWEVRD